MLRAFVEAVGEIPFPCGVLENMDIGTQEALDDYAPMVTQAYSHDAGEFREARLEKSGSTSTRMTSNSITDRAAD